VTEDLTSRFSELVRRELGARDVRLADAIEPKSKGSLIVLLHDGRRIEARFDAPVENPEATTRRLEILVRAFEWVVLDGPSPKKRAPVAISLHDELRALVMRCGAVDAVVIDAHSPVVWASASKGTTELTTPVFPEEVKRMLHLVRESHRGVLLALGKPDSLDGPRSVTAPDLDGPWEPTDPLDPLPAAANEATLALMTRALEQVRRLPQMASLHKGGHLAHTLREDDFGYVARSFAGIYVLLVVFDGPVDEIRAERAVRDGLPRIERLVLALPPLDPEPLPAGVVALRPRRRR